LYVKVLAEPEIGQMTSSPPHYPCRTYVEGYRVERVHEGLFKSDKNKGEKQSPEDILQEYASDFKPCTTQKLFSTFRGANKPIWEISTI
jgi:hypothetical protein